ncbi:hypothetical protein NCS57_01463500 [Fusarium keratoplasticum]|uniref:Uncharacterized protein n=1 Tax=Fusarium keratoplasticum TaxID=1328300 RepID=A0ACC0QC49_9HYPO|nr:hypothetical protein NCS57_01463500 [Fusarium keratoplasticum]KAI8649269.1 hypothetical protein NCS57_01463500 [Fusarium keratoplasticum]
MATFKRVALLGKGLLGSAVLEELVNSDFDVTVFSRSPPSGETLPSGVAVKQVDYTSKESLVAALKCHDVAISTLGPQATLSQTTIIDACISAGVIRYVPSDFGSSTTDPEARGFPVYGPLVRIQDCLKEKAQSGELEYTIFSIGMFLDFVINTPAIIDPDTHTAQIYDKGDVPFSTTSVASIGKAVAGALKNPVATRNKNLFIHDALITQAKVLALAKEASPPGTKWTETSIDAKAELERALKQSIENPMDIEALMPLLKATLLTGVYNSGYKEVDNELVGLPLMTDEKLKNLFSLRYHGKA